MNGDPKKWRDWFFLIFSKPARWLTKNIFVYCDKPEFLHDVEIRELLLEYMRENRAILWVILDPDVNKEDCQAIKDFERQMGNFCKGKIKFFRGHKNSQRSHFSFFRHFFNCYIFDEMRHTSNAPLRERLAGIIENDTIYFQTAQELFQERLASAVRI